MNVPDGCRDWASFFTRITRTHAREFQIFQKLSPNMEFRNLALGGLFEIPKKHKKSRITENPKAHFTVFRWLEYGIWNSYVKKTNIFQM